MKKQLITLLLIITAFAGMAQHYNPKDLYLTKPLTGEAISQIKAETAGGNIIVTGVDENARIEVYIRADNSEDRGMQMEAIKKRLEEDYELTVSAEQHKLTAIAKRKRKNMNWKHSLSVSFIIYVPHTASSNLVTSGGNIVIEGLAGTQDFTTSGGNLEVKSLSGHITGTTSGGNIELSNSKDEIMLTTSGGNIVAKNSTGTIKLRTSGGNLEMNQLNGNINATTSGGHVAATTIDGSLSTATSGGNVDLKNLSCSLETSTSGGNIAVQFKSLGQFVKISNSGGRIEVNLPSGKGMNLDLHADKIKVNSLNNFSGKSDKNSIVGSLNGGGIPVTIHGGGGRIDVVLN